MGHWCCPQQSGGEATRSLGMLHILPRDDGLQRARAVDDFADLLFAAVSLGRCGLGDGLRVQGQHRVEYAPAATPTSTSRA